MKNEYHLSEDKSKLDIELIHSYLSTETYWAKDRSLETVKKSVENSICFGVYLEKEQVAFARVITDRAVFAWITDIFVVKNHKGKGLGKKIMNTIMNHHELQGLRRWGLATKDAHGLYEQFGFHALEKPERFMEIVSENH